MSWSRWIAAAALVGGLAFGLMGGEYSALDSRELRRQIRAQERAIAQLRIEVDSLEQLATALETDPSFTYSRMSSDASTATPS